MSAKNNEPQLEEPGAGLPFYQHFFLRFFVGPFVAARSDWDKNWRTFDSVNQKIFNKLASLDGKQLETRVLIKPLSGIEDSSRYWSAAMTLEHLIVVGNLVGDGIIKLSNNQKPTEKVSIAAVKPKGGIDGKTQLEEYKEFTKRIRSQVEAAKSKALSSTTTFNHPWFGEFSALQWQWMLCAHTLSHYRQIKQIADGLKAPQP